jgi:hypothetical protein
MDLYSLALALSMVAVGVSVLAGLSALAAQGMAVPEFVLEHPSFVVVVVLAALVLWWLPRASA